MALMRRAAVVVALVAVALSGSGCDSTPTAPTDYAPFSKTDLVLGTGTEAVAGLLVRVDYTGWFYDPGQTAQKGVQFETSLGSTPITFQLGAGQVIAGWDQGIVGMKVGGRRRLIIPPSLAYGYNRYGSIPGNTTLVFDVDLVAAGTAPTVTTNPEGVTVTLGQAATFTAAAESDPAPAVQWQVSTDGGTTWTTIDGATATTYTFVPQLSDSGNEYRAVFTNSVGYTITSAATLVVNGG
mgnify:CR=1 FL=1